VAADPVLEALFPPVADHAPDPAVPAREATEENGPGIGRIVDHGERGKLVAGLAINLEERTRVKIAGRMLRGVVLGQAAEHAGSAVDDPERVDVQLAVAVDGALGNCPKYINRRILRPHDATPRVAGASLPLSAEAIDLIDGADLFFISSRHGAESMDTNIRGGAPGFVRVASNSADDGVTLVYPEYSGNRLFQTLGNMRTDPAVGLTFPNFETGDVLYLSGRAEVLIGADAAAVLPHSKLAVRLTVDAARFVEDGLSFRGRLLDQSPYNPAVWRLACEIDAAGSPPGGLRDPDGRPTGVGVATLVRRTPITPTISRYAFRLSADPSSAESTEKTAALRTWRAGQHVTLDFSAQLDRGWSHMRDHDPRSLNDDYVRSFTISSAPPAFDGAGRIEPSDGAEFEITARRNGPVTRFLDRWTPGRSLSVPVLEFGGGGGFGRVATAKDESSDAATVVVVAGGVGITPLMAQAQSAPRSLRILWSVRADDLPLAVDFLELRRDLAARTTLFVTGPIGSAHEADLRSLVRLGAHVHERRMGSGDVLGAGAAGRREFHVCASPGLVASVMDWTRGEPMTVESFDY
jgi:ferredoxin-NADP reductase